MNIQKPPQRNVSADPVAARFIPLAGAPLVRLGDDLANVILAALGASGETLRDGDTVVIAQKIVSKSEGRAVRLDSVTPSTRTRA